MLRTVLVVGLCVGFALCDTLFFRPFGGRGKEDEDTKDPNPLCPDKQGTCPEKSTCCKLASGKYGCCPLPDAVCCSDYTHCCPEGFTCDVAGGACKRGNLVIDWLQQISSMTQPGTGLKTEPASKRVMSTKPGTGLKSKPVSGKPVPCPGGHVECPAGSTCCPLKDKSYGCCPMLGAECCSDHQHCCPKGYKCTSKATCEKTKGQGTMSWIDLVLGNDKQDYKVSKSAKTTNEKITPSSESGYQKNKFAPPKVTGQKSSNKEIPRTEDDDDEDDDSEEDFQQHKDKSSDEKRRKDNKERKPVSNAQEISKPKPVSKKAKENVNIKINDGNEHNSDKRKPWMRKLTVATKEHTGDTKGPTTAHKGDLKEPATGHKGSTKGTTVHKGDIKRPTGGHKGNIKDTTTIHKGDVKIPATGHKGNPKGKINSSAHKGAGKSTASGKIPSSAQETHKGSSIKQSKSAQPIPKSAMKTMQKVQGTKTDNTQPQQTAAKPSLSAKVKGSSNKLQSPTSRKQPTVIKQQPSKAKPVITVSNAKNAAKGNIKLAASKSAQAKVNPGKLPVVNPGPIKKKAEKGVPLPDMANKPFKVPSKNPKMDDQETESDSTGVKKLVYKLGMMTQKIKKLLMDSLIDNTVDNLEHPDTDSTKDKKANKQSKISKTQASNNAGKPSAAGKSSPGKGRDDKRGTLPVKSNPVIKQSVKTGKDTIPKKMDSKQTQVKTVKSGTVKSQANLPTKKPSMEKTNQQQTIPKGKPSLPPKTKSNVPMVQSQKKKTNVSVQPTTKTKPNVSPKQSANTKPNVSPKQSANTKPNVSPKQSAKTKPTSVSPSQQGKTKTVVPTSHAPKTKPNIQRSSGKQQSPVGKQPMGQTKVPFNKQNVKLNPPSRVVKPVAKDVPAQKTTQSVGIKKNVKTNVIDGIPSANLKLLKQQLLKRQQNINVKEQGAARPPVVKQPMKKQPDMKLQSIKPPNIKPPVNKPKVSQQKVNINIPKTAKVGGNPK